MIGNSGRIGGLKKNGEIWIVSFGECKKTWNSGQEDEQVDSLEGPVNTELMNCEAHEQFLDCYISWHLIWVFEEVIASVEKD